MKRWIYIGSVYPPEWEERFGVGSSPTIDVQRSLLAALGAMGWRPDAILTTPPVKRFPKGRLRRFPEALVGECKGMEGVQLIPLGFTNLEPFKTLSIARDLKRCLSSWSHSVRAAGESPRALVYNLGPTHEQGGFLAAISRSLNIPLAPLITDLDFSGKSVFSPSTWRFRWQVRLLRAAERLASLNPGVLEEFGRKKPTLHVPGVVPDEGFFQKLLGLTPRKENVEEKVFLYTGSLNRPRGILRLVEAFQFLSEGRVRLRITGRGSEEGRVREATAGNPMIEYLGFLGTEEERLGVIEQADVLVNPHEIDSPEARYLFPSKLAEYLGSGRLVVSSLLPGMSGFPLDSMVLAKEDTVESLAGALKVAFRMTSEEREQKAGAARAWARDAFDWKHVAGRLLDFMGV